MCVTCVPCVYVLLGYVSNFTESSILLLEFVNAQKSGCERRLVEGWRAVPVERVYGGRAHKRPTGLTRAGLLTNAL